MVNSGIVINVIGVLLILLGGFMLTILPFSYYYDVGDDLSIELAAFITIFIGFLTWFWSRNSDNRIGKREGFLIVGGGWMVISLFSSFPFLFSGAIPDFTNALFESVSGLTTTGASVLNDIESVPKDILLWRSLTQWIGGMGIIVLTVAIFPLLGIGGVELFVAEAPGPASDKIHPRIKETAKRLWFIYLGLTILLMVILYWAGMGAFDAVNHALTTMSTGGFSTKNASIAHFNSPTIEYVLALFMLIGGINYTIIYFGLKGNFKKVWRSDEFKTYLFWVLLLTTVVFFAVFQVTDYTFEKAFRDSVFQVASIVTTTGFVSADYTSWAPVLTLLFFLLLFSGACAGSTSGGVKIIRHLVIFKNSSLEIKRLLHPKAIIRTKVDGKIVAPRILTHILVFIQLYVFLFVIGSLVMAIILSNFEQPFLSSIGAVATALGNVGPSIGELGPLDNFSNVPAAGKWLLMLLMLMGRLELFTIIIFFTPYFWRRN